MNMRLEWNTKKRDACLLLGDLKNGRANPPWRVISVQLGFKSEDAYAVANMYRWLKKGRSA